MSQKKLPIFNIQQYQSTKEQTLRDYKYSNWQAIGKICFVQFLSCFFSSYIMDYSIRQNTRFICILVLSITQIIVLLLSPQLMSRINDQKILFRGVIFQIMAIIMIGIAESFSDFNIIQQHNFNVGYYMYLYLVLIFSGISTAINQVNIYAYTMHCRPTKQTNSGVQLAIIQSVQIIAEKLESIIYKYTPSEFQILCFNMICLLYIPCIYLILKLDVIYGKNDIVMNRIDSSKENDYDSTNMMALLNNDENEQYTEQLNTNKQPKKLKHTTLQYQFVKHTFFKSLNGLLIVLQSINATYYYVYEIFLTDLGENTIKQLPDYIFIKYFSIVAICIEVPIFLCVGFLYDQSKYPKKFLFLLQSVNLLINFQQLMTDNVTGFTLTGFRVLAYLLVAISQGMQFQSFHLIACANFKGNYRIVFSLIFMLQFLFHSIFYCLKNYLMNKWFSILIIIVIIGEVIIKLLQVRVKLL